MDPLTPPDAAKDFLCAPRARLAIEQLFKRGAFEGGFVIAGPQSQGKATLAFLLAATLLSGGQSLGEMDPKVQSLIAAGAHPDLKVLRRRENERTGKLRDEIDVAGARGVIETLHHTSVSGHMVVIVDLADELGRQAANSLLKILEEPPKGATLFLLSRSPSCLLPTLTSRCRRLVLGSVHLAPLSQWIAQRADIPLTEAEGFARDSGGAPGLALRLALGEGGGASGIADSFLRAVAGQQDLLSAARKFGGKGAEGSAEEAIGLILQRLRLKLSETAHERETLARQLKTYEVAEAMFAHRGTADAVQTAYIAGLKMRDALAGKAIYVR
ncbi:MAG: hypothetical protein AAF788_00250 [Pseudomonadota bacterium]